MNKYVKQLIPVAIAALLTISVPLIILNSGCAYGLDNDSRGKIAEKISELKQKNVFKKESAMFFVSDKTTDAEISQVVTKYTLLDLSNTERLSLLNTKPDYLEMTIPVENGARYLTLLLYKVNISPNGFTLLTSDGITHPIDNIVHYRGVLDNDNHSVACISISENETMGMICNNEGNYVLGKIKNDAYGRHIIYNDRNLIPKSDFQCGTNTSAVPQSYNSYRHDSTSNNTLSVKCVNWYWEADYNVFTSLGSISNVNNWLQGVFNQVATLYANDGMTINLQTVFIWTTTSPYIGPTRTDYLSQFGNYRTSFSGDLANLISFANNGGAAWVASLCYGNITARMAYSGVSSSYYTVPTYSWAVECIAHEEGHNFGSNHTNACIWNGNSTAIDGCYGVSGTCPNPGLPSGGGTIMSYCDLTSVGINFSLGFGPQPKALMQYYVDNATCLSSCSGGCATPLQPSLITGSATTCQSTSQTYSIPTVTGATSYTWTLPTGWTGTSSSNSITAITGSASGTISVTANNSCGSSSPRILAVTVSLIPAQPGSIIGSASVCQSSSQTYSVASVTGATSYTWTLPTGWTGTSTTNSITVITGSAGGTISVNANNGCGSSPLRSFTVSIISVPLQPGAITGTASVCTGVSQTYSVAAVTGATSYTWTLPSGWTGTSITNSITVTTGTLGGIISVAANNACGIGAARTLTTTISGTVPAQPGTISGSASVCQSSSQTYSVTSVSGATAYTWTLPIGWTGSSTTNSITAIAGSASGTISVTANNSCGISQVRTLAVTVLPTPAQPGTIAGSASVCQSSSQTYSVTSVSGATTYTWTLPTGWTGISATNSITATAGSAGGTISVTANNSCGSSPIRTLGVTISPILSQPGIITGSISVCQSSSQTYSVTSVSGATSYTWTKPTGWTGTSTTNSITVTTGSAGGTISVTANNGCGSSAARTLAVTVTPVPSQPGTISGAASACQSSSQTYSVASVIGATSYTWTLPTGWTGTSTTNSITVAAGSAGGTISVRANNSCGSSALRSKTVSTISVPSQPGSISGAASVCTGVSQTYSVAVVTGATSYTWTLPSGWTGTSLTNSITVTTGALGGIISVAANNACGIGPARTLTTTISGTAPAQPGTISGSASVCQSSSQTYSITSVTGATSYTWTKPTGWTGTSTTNSITVTAGSAGGTISVTANNSCGSSAARTLAVTVTPVPSQPGTISGAASACQSSSQTYSVASVTGATSYTWTLPIGWTGTSTTNSITVTAGNIGGTISVRANNICGSSALRTKTISIISVPSQPGVISGAISVCQSTLQTYSVASVTGATSYTWTLPIGWTGTSTTNSITVTIGSAGGTISVTANNSCGSSLIRTLVVTVTPASSQPGIISGTTSVCESSSQTYSIASVTGATSYTWTLPTGWTGTSTTNSITVTTGNADGTISVIANNVCGGGPPRTLDVTVIPVPFQPGAISGLTSVCENSSQTYSVASVTGATSYTWTLPIGWTGTSTTNSIIVTTGSAGGNISVNANNSCGISGVQTIALDVSTVPAPFDSIYRSGGRFRVCPGDSRVYSVVLISGLTYNWTVPEGASITSGQGTNIINVTYDNNFIDNGTLSVSASNSCGAGPVTSTLIKRKIPAVPASISGPVSVCNGSVRIYSIAAVPSALSYIWTVPADASIQGSQTGRQISVLWGATGGIITVKAHNNCADSGPQSLAVNVTCRLAETGNDNKLKAELFPNPTSGLVTLKFISNENQTCNIVIADITGREMIYDQITSAIGENEYIVDVSKLANGVYLLKMKTTAGVTIERFVKE